MIRVAVTELEYDKAREVFVLAGADGFECISAAENESGLADAVRSHSAQHVIVGVDTYRKGLYEALPKGGVIARFGVGHDGINKDLATGEGLYCTNTPGVLNDSVAEYTISLMLSVARHVPTLASAMRQEKWLPKVGSELKGKTLAIIGCGAIGRRVAQIASFGLSMNVIGSEVIEMDAAVMKKAYGFAEIYDDFAEAVAEADYVTLHIPSHPATRHFINHQRLKALPPNVWLINTARGAILDESALFDALSAGELAGAALDVFEHEPYQPVQPNKDLRKLDNVILTPHVGSSSQEASNRCAKRALHNIKLACAKRFGEMDLLNPEVCYLLENGYE